MREAYVPKAVFYTLPVVIDRGEGAAVQDVDGNIFLDFAGGIGVLNIGYSHPEVVEEVKKQAEKFLHASINVIQYENYFKLAKRLCEVTPGDFQKSAMMVNSGAEAVENAVKAARRFTGRTEIIAFEGAFHGRTLLTMTLTSKVKPYKYGFGPFAPGVHKMPYPYCYRCPYGLCRETCGLHCAKRFEDLFLQEVAPEDIAAIIIEPVQGEGGFIVPPDDFIKELGRICDRYGILLIADEIQSGFYRTGKLFACEYWGVVPDMITTAKSLGAGLPLSAVVARKEILDSAEFGQLGGTYSGNPVANAAALKVIEIMQRDDFDDKANMINKLAFERLGAMKNRFEIIGDVRGRGAMIALEFVKDRVSKEANKDAVQKIIRNAFAQGLILISAGVRGNVIRFLMPLVITEEQLMKGLDILENSIEQI
ncbi:MAG: Gamma-aminobutyrate:alpha-ketoglutarate aminotransferase [Firmicutes bacterium]|nr:Gamma-aminobutyrate:alpha-ketoglutarate aminotransferase [Bacillota bacterium]